MAEWSKIKDKLELQKFEASDSDWQSMRAMIKKNQNLNSSRLKFISPKDLFITGTILLIAGLSIYLSIPGEIVVTPVNSSKTINRFPIRSLNDSGKHKDEAGSLGLPHMAKSGNKESSATTGVVKSNKTLKPSANLTFNNVEDALRTGKANHENACKILSFRKELASSIRVMKSMDIPGKEFLQPELLLQLKPVGVSLIKSAPRIKIDNISVIGAYSPSLIDNQFYKVGAGADITLSRKKFIFNMGLYQYKIVHYYKSDEAHITINESEQAIVDSAWVVDGPLRGHYAYDTTAITVYDTIRDYDSKSVRRYLELPVFAGYRWTENRWTFECTAGLIFGWEYAQDLIEQRQQSKKFVTDIAFRLAVSYYLSSNLAITGRVGWRFNLDRHEIFSANYPIFQLGLSYNLSH